MIRVRSLFFDMNSYFASVAQQEEPPLIGRPVGVLTTDAPGAACIAASYEAKKFGIKMGTRQEEARKLCPNIAFRPARHDVCVRYHHAIRAAAEEVIPITKAHSVDEFSCTLMGREQNLDTALQIARDLQANIIHKVGRAMRCSVGVASTPLLAKIAAEMKKPMGINWLHPSVLPDKIAHIPLRDIPGISRGMGPRLERAGITTLPQLYNMSPKQARFIWGNVMGERFLRELQGHPSMWPRSKGHTIGHGQILTGANATPNGARLVLRRLLVKAAARLRRDQKFAGGIYISVKCRQSGYLKRYARIKPTQDTLFLLETLNRYWGELQVQKPRSVSVMLWHLIPADQRINDLFDTDHPPDNPRENLCHLLDGLNRRFGQDTVRFGELPRTKVAYTGAKIAFDRVPERADFYE